MFHNQHGLNNLLKDGGKHFSGVDETLVKNIQACTDLSKIVCTSFGPNGMNKLVINHLGRHYITANTATVLRELDVAHPCGRLLVQASEAQDFECGDQTNFCVMLIGELLKNAESLLKEGLHASDIVKGYQLGLSKLNELIKNAENCTEDPNLINNPSVKNQNENPLSLACWIMKKDDLYHEDKIYKAIQSVIGSKQPEYKEVLGRFVSKAIVQIFNGKKNKVNKYCVSSNTTVEKSGEDGSKRPFNQDNVRVCKIPGGDIHKSFVVDGMVIPRPAMGTCNSKEGGVKVAVYGQGIEFQSTEAKGTVLLENAEQLLKFTKDEESNMEEWIKQLHEMNIQCVIAGGNISEIALHFLNKYKFLVIKIASKFELRRICSSLNAISITRQGAPLPEELGFSESVKVEEYASQKVTIFRNSTSSISTIVLRGATASVLDEWERSITDCCGIMRCIATDIQRKGCTKFVAGGGSIEIELARRLRIFASGIKGLEQYSVMKFCEALEVSPKILLDNCGKIGRVEGIAKLYESHSKFKKSDSEDGNSYTEIPLVSHYGLDVDVDQPGKVLIDCQKEGIMDLLSSKGWAVRHALECVLTVLRVDQMIMSKQAGTKQAQ